MTNDHRLVWGGAACASGGGGTYMVLRWLKASMNLVVEAHVPGIEVAEREHELGGRGVPLAPAVRQLRPLL